MAFAPTTADRIRIISRSDPALAPETFDKHDDAALAGEDVPDGTPDSPWRKYVDTLDESVLKLNSEPIRYVCRPFTEPERHAAMFDTGTGLVARQYAFVGTCLVSIQTPAGDRPQDGGDDATAYSLPPERLDKERRTDGVLRRIPPTSLLFSDRRYFPDGMTVLSVAGLISRHGALSEAEALFR